MPIYLRHGSLCQQLGPAKAQPSCRLNDFRVQGLVPGLTQRLQTHLFVPGQALFVSRWSQTGPLQFEHNFSSAEQNAVSRKWPQRLAAPESLSAMRTDFRSKTCASEKQTTQYGWFPGGFSGNAPNNTHVRRAGQLKRQPKHTD